MTTDMTVTTPGHVFPKEGDTVRILRKVPSHSNGWSDSWQPQMDAAVGKTGVVKKVIPNSLDVQVDVPGVRNAYFYPVFVLENLTSQPGPRFTPGQHVVVDYTLAPTKRTRCLATAQAIALQLAKEDTNFKVDADQVQARLARFGFTSADLGNAAGSIFTRDKFVNTGHTVKSTRQGNRGRRIAIWQLVRPIQQPVPQSVYIIEYRNEKLDPPGTWRRSSNTNSKGQRLYETTFSDLAIAQEEAQFQERKAGPQYKYRANLLN